MQRPYDASIQIRVHRTTLATLALFYKNKGHVLASSSALVRAALEDFKDALVLQGHVKDVESVEEAATLLDELNMRSGSRTGRQFLTNLQLEDFTKEGIRPKFRGSKLVGGELDLDNTMLDIIRTVPQNLIAEDDEDDEEESANRSKDK